MTMLALACVTCSAEVQAGVFDAGFVPMLLKVASMGVAAGLVVAGLYRLP